METLQLLMAGVLWLMLLWLVIDSGKGLINSTKSKERFEWTLVWIIWIVLHSVCTYIIQELVK